MAQGILLALSAALVYGFLGVTYEIAAKRHYRIWDVIVYMQLTGLVIGLAVTALRGLPFCQPRLLAMGLLGAVTFVAALGSYLQASRERDIAANWTIVNLSVILPILVSVWWFKDVFSLTKGLGVIFTVASIVVIGGGFQKAAGATPVSRWMIYIGLAFFLNAWLVILLRFVPTGYGPVFTAYLYGIGFLVVSGYKVIRDSRWPRERTLIGIGMVAAVMHWSGLMLTMAALEVVGRFSSQAGLVVYPITNGLVIPLAVILGALILKQKVSLRSGMGVGLGMIAMVLLSFS